MHFPVSRLCTKQTKYMQQKLKVYTVVTKDPRDNISRRG